MRVPLVLLLVLLVAIPAVPRAASSPGATGPSAPTGPMGRSVAVSPAPDVAASAIASARHALATGESGSPVWTCHGDPAWANNACRLSRYALAPRGASSGTGWVQGNTSPPPQSDDDFEMTYDASDGVVLLLGSPAGLYGSPTTTDFWSYRNGNWTNLGSTTPPFNCPGSSLAYDSADGYVVFYGATVSYYATRCPTGGTTWSYHAGRWSNLTAIPSPPARWGASLINDSTDGYLLLFGGNVYNCTGFVPTKNCNLGYLNDTWKFQAGVWTRLSPKNAPSWRSNAGLADDPVDGYVVLFGGSTYYNLVNDTWKFVGGTWTDLHPARSPPLPVPDGFSFDAADGVLLYTNVYPNFNDTTIAEVTWAFSAGAWAPITFPYGPTSRSGAEQAYDYADGYTLFFGGLVDRGGTDLSDVWSYVGGAWTNRTPPTPSPRTNAMVAYDAATKDVLLFGGETDSDAYGVAGLNDTWTYGTAGWMAQTPAKAPPAREGGGMVYDAADGYILLFGGDAIGGSGWLNDTWEYAGGLWAQITPGRSPPVSSSQTMVYDAADGYAMLFENASGIQSTWTYHAGTWTNRTLTAGTPPGGPALNPLVYDSSDGYVLLFGTFQRTLTNQTFKFAGGTWTNLTGSAGIAPAPASDASFADYPAGGYVVLWTATPSNFTWTFANGTWSALYAPLGPTPRSGMAGAYDPKLSADVFFGGDGGLPECLSFGLCGSTWLWSSGGANVPSIRSFTVQPSPTDVGASVTFSVVVIGGVPPWTFAYSGLPTGCTTANSSSLLCSPSAAGSSSVSVQVTDSSGNSTVAYTSLRIVARPGVVLSVSHASIPLGRSTLLYANVSGGLSPYSYNYSGLPPGCASQTVPALPCTPTTAGGYTVRVVVQDGAGVNTSATTGLSVAPAGATGAPSITSFNATPSAFVLGNSTNLTVLATGGTPPYYYTFSGLAPGCSSANLSVLGCTPTASGTFAVVVNVTDATGNGTALGTNVTVYPAGGGAGLKVSAFGPTAPSATVGSPLGLKVVASGGHGGLSYSYGGLPPGCASLSRSELSCTPMVSGEYRIRATVADAASDRVTVPLDL
ncbi:MAG: hypothetical protein L3K08_02785, partial [Thermoplasmata archaeon]|nr:hypothetical protein [Thermoplasmata archaeon]